ncbi:MULTISPECIES: hypothetical protein, partial [Bacteroides]
SIAKRKYSRTVKYKRGCANVLTQPHHFFTLTPVMPMNKGIEPMGESVRVKTAITFICERYFSNQE